VARYRSPIFAFGKLHISPKRCPKFGSAAENYSDGMAKTYIEYLNGERRDEDKLISPILLRKFL